MGICSLVEHQAIINLESPPIITLSAMTNGNGRMDQTSRKQEVVTQQASYLIRSTTPNTQWWWVAGMIKGATLIFHQWRSSKKELRSGFKVKAATFFVLCMTFLNQDCSSSRS